MEKYLTNLLQRKCESENCEILYSEWLRDKELARRILQNVSNTAPNYTIHDSSHSDAIIDYIVRILGKDIIEKFSATDIWMILFSAYYHDIGMVVSYKDIEKIFSDEDEFKNFTKKIIDLQKNKASGLNEAASELNVDLKKKEIGLRSKILKSKLYIHLIELINDIFRSNHGERSKQFIRDSFAPNESLNQLGITTIIPQRLFIVLADICAAHNWNSFNKVLEIPNVEKGMGGDECHPRMIACLLRLGDVLDIDNNRFDPTSLAFVGVENIPADSTLHIRKHCAIKHFSVNQNRIEIRAKVDIDDAKTNDEEPFDDQAYEVAEQTNNWFKWIKEELSNQKQHIGLIYPDEYSIKLPELDIEDCQLGENYIYLKENERPKFSIDSNEAFELLRGMNLYQAPWQSIRELVQNAIDATLIRYWQDNKEEIEKESDQTQLVNEFHKKIKKYNIELDLTKKNDTRFDGYKVEIKDKGIGFAKEDLQYLLKVGSAKNNPQKEELTEGMPEWLKPSGTFGIGFQSIFMITDYVVINTKSLITKEKYCIKLFKPNGKHEGSVLIKKLKDNYSESPFTSVMFKVDKSIFESKSLGGKSLQNITEEFSSKKNFDLFGWASDSVNINAMLMELQKYLQYTIVPVQFKVNGKDYPLSESKTFDNGIIELSDIEGYKEALQCQLYYELYSDDISSYAGNNKIFYKNQYVCDYDDYTFPYINIYFNILSGNASDWLTLDRNRILGTKENELDSIIKEALRSKLFNMTKPKEDEKEKLSMVYYVFLKDPSDKDVPDWLLNDWKSLKIKELENKSFAELKGIKHVRISKAQSSDAFKIEEDKLTISGEEAYDGLYNLRSMLNVIYRRKATKIKLSNDGDILMEIGEEDNNQEFELDFENYNQFIKSLIKERHSRLRYFIPVNEKYKRLSINLAEYMVGEIEKNVRPCLPFDMDTKCKNITISPFVLSGESANTEALALYIYNHRRYKETNLVSIKELLNKLVEEFG